MDLGSALVGFIVMLICCVPFVLMGIAGKQKEKHGYRSLIEKAAQYHCHITQYDIMGNTVIGLDRDHLALFFQKTAKHSHEITHIDLITIRSCRVSTKEQRYASKGKEERLIDRLELVLMPKDEERHEIRLVFFDSGETFQVYHGEIAKAKNWASTINNLIGYNQPEA